MPPDSHPSHPPGSGSDSRPDPRPARPDSPPDSPIARLRGQVREAMKAGNRPRTDALRMLLSEANKIRIDSGAEPDQPKLFALAEKMIKQRRESADLYAKAGRAELAEKENAEIAVLQEFLPPRLSDSEVARLVADAIADPANGRGIGKIMAALRPEIAGRADAAAVAAQVKNALK